MANLRTGKYGGEYYGSYYNESVTLSSAEMHKNAEYIHQVLKYIYGWSENAIAGLLGNTQYESALNPGRWQSDKVDNNNGGYGLVQWTPATKYIDWCRNTGRNDPSEMDNNIERIIYEVENNVQYIKTPDYSESFSAFTQSTKSPYYLACAFAWNYERSYVVLYGTEAEQEALRQKRGGSADYWYQYITTYLPDPDNPDYPDPEPEPEPTPVKKKPMPVWMMCRYY